MEITDLTVGQITQILAAGKIAKDRRDHLGLGAQMIGTYVIIRTYSAGVWAGNLDGKDGKEVILSDARRMWRWFAAKGISLSECALYGINAEKSRIAESVPLVWLEAIEIIPCCASAITSLKESPNAQPS